MLSKEEIYKTNYMQIPCTMLTKKNLDRLEEHCKRSIRYDAGKRFREHEIVLELLDKYKQLETREQKLIDKLEEIVKSKYIAIFEGDTEFEDDAIEMKTVKYIKVSDIEEILSILKDNKKTTFPKK